MQIQFRSAEISERLRKRASDSISILAKSDLERYYAILDKAIADLDFHTGELRVLCQLGKYASTPADLQTALEVDTVKSRAGKFTESILTKYKKLNMLDKYALLTKIELLLAQQEDH